MKKVSKADFLSAVDSMSEDQFKDFLKDHHREVRDMTLWSKGEAYLSKSVWAIMMDFIGLTTQIDDLEFHVSEHPEDVPSIEQLNLLKAKLEMEFESLEGKVDSFGSLIKLWEKDVERYEFMGELFFKKSNVKKNQVKRMKERIVTVMQGLQMDKIEGEFFKMALGKPTQSVVLNEMSEEEIALLPEKFKVTKVQVDKAAVKESLKSGELIAWAALEHKTGLRIT